MNCTDSMKYGLMTGQCVNKMEIMKVLEIKPDKTWKLFIAGRQVDISIIGLSDMTCNSYQSVKIIFHTVRLATICRGKVVNRKLSSRKYSYVQEWSTCGDENNNELRLTSKKCLSVLSFAATRHVFCVY